MFHECSISWFLISQAFEVEAFFYEHTIELAPGYNSFVAVVCLIEQSKKALIYLLFPVLKFSLPWLEVFDALWNKLIEGQLVIVLFESILEEAKNVFVDIDS